MDPIEKLLSELAPAPGRRELDHAMDALFAGAEARAKRRVLAGASVAAAALLFVGISIGYLWGSAREVPVAVPAPAVANAVTLEPPAKPIFDFTTTKTWPTAPLEAQVVKLPARSLHESNGEA